MYVVNGLNWHSSECDSFSNLTSALVHFILYRNHINVSPKGWDTKTHMKTFTCKKGNEVTVLALGLFEPLSSTLGNVNYIRSNSYIGYIKMYTV